MTVLLGLELRRGEDLVVVRERAREVAHLVTGRPTWIPLGTSANKAGRVAGANAAGGRERFPGVVGTSILSIFGVGFATTGFSVARARAEGFAPVAARIEAYTRPKYYGGTKTTVELVADRATRRADSASRMPKPTPIGSLVAALILGMRAATSLRSM